MAMRELTIQPCDHQKALMESLGFQYASSSYDWPRVRWMGHGIAIELWNENDCPTAKEAVTAIVHAARAKGSEERRLLMQKALAP